MMLEKPAEKVLEKFRRSYGKNPGNEGNTDQVGDPARADGLGNASARSAVIVDRVALVHELFIGAKNGSSFATGDRLT